MWPELIAAAFLLCQYVYHRWIEDQPEKPGPGREISIPRVDDGAVVPMIYGRCRVNAPFLAWISSPTAVAVEDVGMGIFTGWNAGYMYFVDMFFLVGIPFYNGSSHIHRIWVGDRALIRRFSHHLQLEELDGSGDHETILSRQSTRLDFDGADVWSEGHVEFLNGNSDQLLVDAMGVSLTYAADKMIADGIDAGYIPGYRGYLGVTLSDGQDFARWIVGTNPAIPPYAFEMSSYLNPGPIAKIGHECNPIHVLIDLITGIFAKLGMSSSFIDTVSFDYAAQVCVDEELGFSRAWEDSAEADDRILEILKFVDGVLYEDDSKVYVKLIRADYDLSACLNINPDNCEDCSNFAAGGWTNIVNKVRVVYLDRQNGYREMSVTAHNQANAAGQDGVVNEVVLRILGICTAALARRIAARELAARSRPIAKWTATVDRSFLRTFQGDVVTFTWPEANISAMPFRVANVRRGDRLKNKIELDLIQDYFYVHRLTVSEQVLAAHPAVAVAT